MGKREEQSFVDELPDTACGPASSIHLPRQTPRRTAAGLNDTGNVIPMKRKKDPSAADGEATADSLSTVDRRRMTDQIGRQLRGMYDGLLNQPVPDRFTELMKQLESGEREAEHEQ